MATAVFGFAGLSLLDNAIALDPQLPAMWNSIGFRVQWRGRKLRARIEREKNQVSATLEDGEPLKLIVAGEEHELICAANAQRRYSSSQIVVPM